jgi:membrane-associated protease RseP (regulator of RpoE activity)
MLEIMPEPQQPLTHTFQVAHHPEFAATQARRQPRYWLHGLLLLLTMLTTLTVGAQFEANFLHRQPAFSFGDGFLPLFDPGVYWRHPALLLMGVPFSVALIAILLAHELGHYLLCVRNRVDATLPFFIPVPFMIGTMGAFIRIKSRIRSRQQLFDIGVAGPIAGFVVAFPLLLLGLHYSGTVVPKPTGDFVEVRFPAVFYFAHALIKHMGQAAPLEHIALHPVAVAAWVGMFATSLNLLPGGQLDGGHIIYSVAPRAHKWVTRTMVVLLAMLSYLWPGWMVWAVILGVTGWWHPPVAPWPELSGKRKVIALAAFALLVVTFVPVPIPGQGWLGAK